MSVFQATITNPKSDLLTEALGISKNRLDLLQGDFKDAVKTEEEAEDNGDVSQLILTASQNCQTVNEAIFTGYVVGQFIQHSRNQNDLQEKLLAALGQSQN